MLQQLLNGLIKLDINRDNGIDEYQKIEHTHKKW